MTANLYTLAREGQLDVLCAQLAEGSDQEDDAEVIYQWLQVAACLGNELADEMADDLYEAALSRGGDETVACLHYEVAEWFLGGLHGIAADTVCALDQLTRAEELQLRASVYVDKELRAMRTRFSGEDQARFDAIFPGLTAS